MKNLWPGWEIMELIGTGGFSKVYKIRKTDDSTGDYFSALKVISIPQSNEEYETYVDEGYDDATITEIFSSQVKRIVDEFRLMSRFKGNSNIVSYEDHMIVPHEDGKGWDILIRMELLTPLTKYNAKNILSATDVAKMGIDICRALELCQKTNVIHRDVKPQNIFISEFGDFKLGDFGIAKTMEQTSRATKTGTYTYMAPEVYKGEAYNSTIDIYSLGLVLYWALNEKRLPFLPLPPQAPTANEMDAAQAKRLRGEALPAPKNGNDQLKAAILTACQFDSTKRFQTPEQFRMALESALRSMMSASATQAPAATVDDSLDKTVSLGPQPVKPQPAPQPVKPQPAPQPVKPQAINEDKTISIARYNTQQQAQQVNNKTQSVAQPKPAPAPIPNEATMRIVPQNAPRPEYIMPNSVPAKKKKSKLPLVFGIIFSFAAIGAGAYLILSGMGILNSAVATDFKAITETAISQAMSLNDYTTIL